jgi:hypothetical protein
LICKFFLKNLQTKKTSRTFDAAKIGVATINFYMKENYFFKMNHFLFLTAFFTCICIVSCKKEQEQVINTKVEEAVKKFRDKKMTECRSDLLQKAEKIVDSLLLQEARASLQDSLLQNKPSKPAQPSSIPPIDSAVVAPLFK